MNLGAFGIVILLDKGENISDYNGLSKSHPYAAALMLVFMFSLAGIPPTAGFIGKFYIFMAAINAGYTWLVAIAVYLAPFQHILLADHYEHVHETPWRDVRHNTITRLAAALFISAVMIFVIA